MGGTAMGGTGRRVAVVSVMTVIAMAVAVFHAGASRAAPAGVATGGAGHRAAATYAESSASAAARRTGRRVEVDALGTASGRVFAEPDGTFTAEVSAQPTRVRRGSGWVPVDTSLRGTPDGIEPGATALGLRFSAGGTASLAVMSTGTWSLALYWPTALPAPVLRGDSATYRDVLPGVDLVASAAPDGFAERLVVRTRAAAADPRLARIGFALRGQGIVLRADAAGALSGVDGTGEVAVSAPPPVMWDATGVRRPVGLALSGQDLVLHPDLGMLASPETAFPVVIDPSYAAKRLNWAQVMSGYPDTSYWNGANLDYPNDPNGPAMVGLDPYYLDVKRVFYQMDTSAVQGKHILKATFQITEKWANNCTATPVELWETGGIGSGTTWRNSSSIWTKRLGTQTVAHGNEDFGCGDGQVDFDATSAVVDAAKSGWSKLTVGLRASDEGTTAQWKRFDTNPTIAINYNSVPNQPSGLTVEGKGCATGSGRPYVGTVTPTLRATVTDPDAGTLLSTSFSWAPVGGTINGTDKVTQNGVATGSQAVVPVPAGRLVDGSSYFFQVQDTDGTDTSPWSAQCEFTVDTDRPAAPPAVSSTDYPADGNFHGGMGQTGGFSLAPGGVADVAAYQYGWADPPTTQVTASALGGPATIAATPPAQGINTLYVRSVDRAGNVSDITAYVFLAGGPTAPVAWWTGDEGSGTTLHDSSSGGHVATLYGTTSWGDGRLHGADRSVTFDGSTGYAEAGPVLQTGQSFTVAAWVVLSTASTGGWRAAVTQNGPAASAFSLSYSGSAFAFTIHGTDAAGNVTATNVIAPGVPDVQAWVHLAGVYDAGTHQALLYVDGHLAALVNNVTPLSGTSSLDIGRERWSNAWTDYWPGQVDEVRLWQRVVYPDEIAKVANGPALVGQWDLDEGAGATAGDATGYHPAALSGGYGWTTGYNGQGAVHFGGGNAAAVTGGQVVHTDASFSVAAWVRLADNTSYRGVLSEDGTTDSGFQLQYSPACTCWEAVLPDTNTSNPATHIVEGPSGAAVGVWTHLAFVYDAGDGSMRLYINGARAGSITGPTNLWGATGAFAIGRTRWNGGNNSWFIGDIDNVRAYEGVLSDADVADLFNQ
jgi:hypothetical protein